MLPTSVVLYKIPLRYPNNTCSHPSACYSYTLSGLWGPSPYVSLAIQPSSSVIPPKSERLKMEKLAIFQVPVFKILTADTGCVTFQNAS